MTVRFILLCWLCFYSLVIRADTHYVATNALSASPYASWTDAASNIQWAVSVGAAGDTILVSNGVYDAGGTNCIGYYTTNRVCITNSLTLRSANNDPNNTIIKGAWDPAATNGPLAVRCVGTFTYSSVLLIGFTLTNGATLSTNESSAEQDLFGAGVYDNTGYTTISNCVIVGNVAYGKNIWSWGGGGLASGNRGVFNTRIINNVCRKGSGGGAAFGTLSNCTIVGNSAYLQGGGVYRGTLYNCIVASNYSVSTHGGGICGVLDGTPPDEYVKAYNCTIVSNYAAQYGGGAAFVMMKDCLVSSNKATYGGGVSAGRVTNCIVVYNQANAGGGCRNSIFYNSLLSGNQGSEGGAVSRSDLFNCTVVGNYASSFGGGLATDSGIQTVFNCIVYSNDAPSYPNWRTNMAGTDLTFSNSCTSPEHPGWAAGNITNDPMFVANGSGYGTNLVPGNYRLTPSSPCVNRGLNQSWMTNSYDLDGRTRIRYGTVDMGAYELILSGTMYIFH